jgi:hypothetical protein
MILCVNYRKYNVFATTTGNDPRRILFRFARHLLSRYRVLIFAVLIEAATIAQEVDASIIHRRSGRLGHIVSAST